MLIELGLVVITVATDGLASMETAGAMIAAGIVIKVIINYE